MTPEVKNRIARKILIRKLSEEGLSSIGKRLKRDVPNMAKELEEKPEDLRTFIEELVPEIIVAKLGCHSVEVVWKQDIQESKVGAPAPLNG